VSDPIFVSYATPKYRKAMEGLVASLENLCLDFLAAHLPSLGSWRLDCLRKIDFLSRMLKAHDRPVVWIDADAKILDYPEMLFHVASDLAYSKWESPGGSVTMHLTGTIYLSNTSESRAFLDHWASMAGKDVPCDMTAFIRAVNTMKVSQFHLPVEYCWIENYHDRFYGNEKKPIILHYRHSRLHRKGENP